MSPEKQRIAIAEACGWEGPFQREWLLEFTREGGDQWADPAGTNPDGERDVLPDYLNDLNAMHEAEQLLHAGQLVDYVKHLATRHPTFCVDVIDDRDPEGDWHYEMSFLITATAALRAEAFLRTLNLWEDA